MEIQGDIATEHTYVQVLQCPDHVEMKDFEEDVEAYVRNVINDTRGTLGNLFYKGNVSIATEQMEFEIQLNLFSMQSVPPRIDELLNAYLAPLVDRGMTLVAAPRILQRKIDVEREPRYIAKQEESPGCGNIPGDNFWQKFLNWWLIVPKVQCDFFDLLYQLYTFDITHQGFIPKFVHFFTIPCNVMLSMCFLAQFSFFGVKIGNGAWQINGSFALFLVLVIMYLIMGLIRKCKTWGLATSVVIFVCWITGNLWYAVYKAPGNSWYNPTTIASNPILWSYIISFIQASSHLAVPQMPPYITGLHHWESMHAFFCKKYQTSERTWRGRLYIVAALLCFPLLSVAVAWFSWPHLIGTMVFYIMAGIGYQHSSFKKYRRVVEKAELSGNPGLDHFPTRVEDLKQSAAPFITKLQECRLVSKNATRSEIVKSVTTLKLYNTYFHHGTHALDENFNHHMLAVREGIHLA
ncbi:uncharacterized protein LOC128558118 [Mercenaria mercenaria]|uniref:uncharacterized protein LOC128558118 n=1 Tax=Mercenaria mercenaria TaxID=6596 RepID=UPI00234F2749|nr:uncharacterized protein LOC128558118 [Mercenaria mercenaria]XP_053402942.1 uncharacterized protein LOC128558118 [Mercenaria mercenaria]